MTSRNASIGKQLQGLMGAFRSKGDKVPESVIVWPNIGHRIPGSQAKKCDSS